MDVDVIKIDKSIINESDEDDYELVYITLISDMCAKNKIKVCVEGIEKEEQLKRLEEVNVDFYQGFYYSIPLSDDDFLDKIMKKEQD
jgi:EAL domain-containing protein (putative c-di-GMP-specific phosphodiesterase class I)